MFLDMATYMDVGAPVSSPLENTVEASGTLAQYYLSKGCTLGAYAYNTSGGTGELLSPEAGAKQFNRLMRMLTGLRSGDPQEDLIRAVEWCKDFLFQLRPEVFIITRLDVHYSRPGETAESFERFIGRGEPSYLPAGAVAEARQSLCRACGAKGTGTRHSYAGPHQMGDARRSGNAAPCGSLRRRMGTCTGRVHVGTRAADERFQIGPAGDHTVEIRRRGIAPPSRTPASLGLRPVVFRFP